MKRPTQRGWKHGEKRGKASERTDGWKVTASVESVPKEQEARKSGRKKKEK